MMNRLSVADRSASIRWLFPTLVACGAFVVLCHAPAVHSQSFVETDAALYRCAVLGDTRSCRTSPTLPTVRIEERIELGPKAQYLRYLGLDSKAAIEEARAMGEQPVRRVELVTQIQLTSKELYERGTGQRVIPSERRETISVSPVLDATVDLHETRIRPASK